MCFRRALWGKIFNTIYMIPKIYMIVCWKLEASLFLGIFSWRFF